MTSTATELFLEAFVDSDSPSADQLLLTALRSTGMSQKIPLPSLIALLSTCRSFRELAKEQSTLLFKVLDLSPLRAPEEFFSQGITSRAEFSRLREVKIQFADLLFDEHLSLLPKSVTHLSLDACHSLTDKGVKSVAQRIGRSLLHFSIYWNSNVTDAAAVSLSVRCSSLTSLSLSGCQKVSSNGVLALASRCRKLQRLNLTRLPLVADLGLSTILQANPHISELRLYADSQFTSAPITVAATVCSTLALVDLTGLSLVDDAALVALGQSCKRLHEAILSWCTAIGDVGVCALACGCPLQRLSLHGSRLVSTASLDALESSCAATLRGLDVRGCTRIPEREPCHLRRRFHRLTEFVIHT
uniref:F-box/LRR-repeat protein 15-like leucin rich repeat domain-containing protein n=1 Tax=Chrysotila carterae TaxID=13221 RepID=A0A7S4FCU9_CHRCT|mmetsp:Transcript_21428/g.45221  ORF Transcript_21428/g.45221 Transcript_21428/m.45221 type:complete len:359 (-) Transcript_21428:525-1601(-)